MSFHEVRFPASLSFGSVGGPERRTDIVTLANGFEERNSPWAHGRRRYDAGLGLRSMNDVEALIGFFEARRGQLFGFRWKDWSDYRSCLPNAKVSELDQLLGVGDGVTAEFALVKRYVSGPGEYQRPISKPVDGSVLVAVGDDLKAETTEYSLDVEKGLIRFSVAPDKGARVTAGYEFDVPVRFDTDRIAVSMASFQAGDVPSVPVVEVRV